MKKKPDRFTRLATNMRLGAEAAPYVNQDPYTIRLDMSHRAEQLLRAEHKAVVRLVKRECAGACECQDYILAALSRRVK